MLAGTVLSALVGGVAGLAFAVLHDQGLAQSVLAYQLGGMIAVSGFLGTAVTFKPQRR